LPARSARALHRTRRQVTANPLRYIKLPPNLGKRRERVALAGEAERLIARLEPKEEVPYGIAFYAGLRRGEIDRLDWVDIASAARLSGPTRRVDEAACPRMKHDRTRGV
jgi:integrase